MKKIKYKIIIIILFTAFLLFLNKSIANAATAGISASSTDAKVGDSVNINVSINAIAWNLKINGSGISDTIVGGNMDELANKVTNKSYKLNTSNPGNYTVSLSGDITDANGTPSNISGSVTIKVSEKSTTTSTNTEKPQEPTFTATNQTVYATGDINIRSSYSTSSKAVGSLKKGDSVTRIGIGNNGWSKVTYNGTTAYISSSLLTTTKPKEEEKSTNKALKSLSIEQAKLEPEFNKDTINYAITVGKDIDSLKINAVAEDEKAKVTISGNEKLQEGNNTVKVLVTAEDGTIRTYTIIVTKEEKDKLKLSSLEIDGISLNEKFNSDTYEYTANLDGKSNVTKLNIKATANDENATIEVIGNESLVVGENVVTIMVKSKDGSENVTYQILVNKSENTNTEATSNTEKNNKMFIFWAIGIFAIAVILIILIIIKSKKKSKEETEFGFDYNNDNITEELYGIKKEDEIKENIEKINNIEDMEETYSDTTDHTKLYDVEKEVDFSEDERKTKKKGKHSK